MTRDIDVVEVGINREGLDILDCKSKAVVVTVTHSTEWSRDHDGCILLRVGRCEQGVERVVALYPIFLTKIWLESRFHSFLGSFHS